IIPVKACSILESDPTNDDVNIIPVNEYCKSQYMNIFVGCIYAYKGLLMIFGCFLAWETRHVSIPALNDSKYIGMSVYNSVMMCLIGAPLSHVLSDKQDASFVIISIFIIFCTTATLCLVFLPKLIELKRNPNGTIEKRLRTTIKPPFTTRRTSATSLYETELKSAKQLNQKYRKQIREIDNEIQALAKILGDDAQEILHDAIHNLALPKSEVLKKEDTDVSSLYSLNSDGGEDVFIESPQKKRSGAKYPGGLPAPWEAVTAGVLNSAKTILFAPELGSVVSKSDSGAPVEPVPSVTTTSPSEEPITVEEKSLPKRPEEEKGPNGRVIEEGGRAPATQKSPPPPPPPVQAQSPAQSNIPAPPLNSSGRPTETLMDLYSQLPLKSNFQPIQYPLQSRLNKSEYDIIHIEGGPGQDGLGILISDGKGSLSRAKKSSVSESHLTVIMGPSPGQTHDGVAPSSTTQEEIWTMLQKERRYIERNTYCEENEVVITDMGEPSSSFSGGVSFLSKNKMTSSFEDNHQIPELQPFVGSNRHLRKLSAPVLPLAIRRQQNREGSQIISLPPLVSGGVTAGWTGRGDEAVVVVDGSRRASSSGKETKRLKSPTQKVSKPGGLRLKTDYDDDQEIIFSSSCDLPNFSSSTGHIDHCSSRGEHHTSSVRLSSGRGHSSHQSGVNHSSSEDIPKGHHHHLRGGISSLRGGGRISPGDGTSKQTLSKYRSYSVPKRLDNSVLNFSEINLDVSLLPIFHKILSERRSLRDSHHHRHHSQSRPVDRSKKAEKEKFMVSCPNIMIKCDIVEYL
ncbi:unnamed protein product, partial [Allacma fusca]